MTQLPALHHIISLSLRHEGDCYLRGVTPDLSIYVEEVYGDDDWMAQHALQLDGTVLASADEQFGENPQFSPIPLPQDIVTPAPLRHSLHLNFTGPRYRGLRESERIADLVSPLSVQDKITLTRRLELDLPPPLVLGLAESTVLAEAVLSPPDVYLVCRRCRLAYALPEPRFDAANLPYDYDTRVFYAVHIYDSACDDELSTEQLFAGLPSVALHRPMDCLVAHDHVWVAEGGAEGRPSAVHVWRVERS